MVFSGESDLFCINYENVLNTFSFSLIMTTRKVRKKLVFYL